MSEEKRNCVFTGLPATAKLIISSSKHSWTKSVPCTKEYLESKKNNSLTYIEFKLIELFYLKELALLKKDFFEGKMQELREMLTIENHETITLEDIEIVNITPEEAKELTKQEEPAKIILGHKNIWE